MSQVRHSSSLMDSRIKSGNHSDKKKRVTFEQELREYKPKNNQQTSNTKDPMMEKLKQWKKEREIKSSTQTSSEIKMKQDPSKYMKKKQFENSLRSYSKSTLVPVSSGKKRMVSSIRSFYDRLKHKKNNNKSSSQSQYSPMRLNRSSVFSIPSTPQHFKQGFFSETNSLCPSMDRSNIDFIDQIEDRIEDLYYDFVDGKMTNRQQMRQEIIEILHLCGIEIVKGLMVGGVESIKLNQQLWYIFTLNFDFKQSWKENALIFLKENKIMQEEHLQYVEENINLISDDKNKPIQEFTIQVTQNIIQDIQNEQENEINNRNNENYNNFQFEGVNNPGLISQSDQKMMEIMNEEDMIINNNDNNKLQVLQDINENEIDKQNNHNVQQIDKNDFIEMEKNRVSKNDIILSNDKENNNSSQQNSLIRQNQKQSFQNNNQSDEKKVQKWNFQQSKNIFSQFEWLQAEIVPSEYKANVMLAKEDYQNKQLTQNGFQVIQQQQEQMNEQQTPQLPESNQSSYNEIKSVTRRLNFQKEQDCPQQFQDSSIWKQINKDQPKNCIQSIHSMFESNNQIHEDNNNNNNQNNIQENIRQNSRIHRFSFGDILLNTVSKQIEQQPSKIQEDDPSTEQQNINNNISNQCQFDIQSYVSPKKEYLELDQQMNEQRINEYNLNENNHEFQDHNQNEMINCHQNTDNDKNDNIQDNNSIIYQINEQQIQNNDDIVHNPEIKSTNKMEEMPIFGVENQINDCKIEFQKTQNEVIQEINQNCHDLTNNQPLIEQLKQENIVENINNEKSILSESNCFNIQTNLFNAFNQEQPQFLHQFLQQKEITINQTIVQQLKQENIVENINNQQSILSESNYSKQESSLNTSFIQQQSQLQQQILQEKENLQNIEQNQRKYYSSSKKQSYGTYQSQCSQNRNDELERIQKRQKLEAIKLKNEEMKKQAKQLLIQQIEQEELLHHFQQNYHKKRILDDNNQYINVLNSNTVNDDNNKNNESQQIEIQRNFIDTVGINQMNNQIASMVKQEYDQNLQDNKVNDDNQQEQQNNQDNSNQNYLVMDSSIVKQECGLIQNDNPIQEQQIPIFQFNQQNQESIIFQNNHKIEYYETPIKNINQNSQQIQEQNQIKQEYQSLNNQKISLKHEENEQQSEIKLNQSKNQRRSILISPNKNLIYIDFAPSDYLQSKSQAKKKQILGLDFKDIDCEIIENYVVGPQRKIEEDKEEQEDQEEEKQVNWVRRSVRISNKYSNIKSSSKLSSHKKKSESRIKKEFKEKEEDKIDQSNQQ